MSNSNIDWSLLSQTFKLAYLLDYQNDNIMELFKDYRSDNQKDIDMMVIRARKIFDSFTGDLITIPLTTFDKFGNTLSRYHQGYQQYIDKINNNIYFQFRLIDDVVTVLNLVVHDIGINIPIESMTTGLGLGFISKKMFPNPDNGVINVNGEIADFIDDYFDDYGCQLEE